MGNSILPRDTGDLVIEFNDANGTPIYRLQPYPNYLCYVLYEWSEVKKKATGEKVWEWKQLECYPGTLEYACRLVRDKLVMTGGCADDITSLTEVRKTITRSTNSILTAIKELSVNKGYGTVANKRTVASDERVKSK